ncbi:MAG: urease accessory protein UreD [Alphaproteobacteria bacterium]|nr:MAG: urease accessory protein UreD [Alphaproteobacteria bacterium]
MQRVAARGLVAVHRDGDRTRLAELYQEGAAQIRLPAGTGEMAEAILINTAGGMTGGDRLSWAARAGAGAGLSLTTQACEKVYRSAGGAARVDVRLEAGPGARLAWLPQETILFDRAALERRLSVDVAADATCLLVEAVILGRAAMGETVRACSFRDSWRVRVAGRLVHAEELRLAGDAASLFARAAVGGGAAAMASLLLVGADAPQRLDAVRDVLSRIPAARAGASAWRVGGTGKLLARLLAADGYHLRGALKPLIELLNGEAGLPRIWSL